jgi:4-amino-4-deoxy-L-arabinose transferase-like glycosyltransferase
LADSKYIIALGFLVFTAAFLAFYPSNYGIVDEAAYLTTSYTFSRGEIYYDQAGLSQVPMMVATATGHTISKYPPGNSLLMLPFTVPGWRIVFLRGWFLTGLCLLLFTMLLAFYRIPRMYALLFLFFPPVVLFSRTIMSDLPAMLLALAGLYFFVTKRNVWAGVFTGLGVYVRYPLALLVIAFALVLLARKETKNLLTYCVSASLGLVPLLGYHICVFGNILGPAFQYGTDLGFSVQWGTLGGYALSLIILYPAMPAAPFLYRGKDKGLFISAVVIYFLFHAFQSYIDTSNNFMQWLVMSQRYMLPIIPFMLVPYAAALDRIKIARKLIVPVIAALVFACVFINYQHAQFLKVQDRYQRLIYHSVSDRDAMICNKDVFELVNPYIKYINWIPFEKQRKLIDVGVLSEDKSKIYIACLARDAQIAGLFRETLERFPFKTEIYTENSPCFFSIWRLDKLSFRF